MKSQTIFHDLKKFNYVYKLLHLFTLGANGQGYAFLLPLSTRQY
jgi:hypothetical protein